MGGSLRLTSWFLVAASQLLLGASRQSQRPFNAAVATNFQTSASLLSTSSGTSSPVLSDPHLRGKVSQFGSSASSATTLFNSAGATAYRQAPPESPLLQCTWTQRFPGVYYNGKVIESYSGVASEEHCVKLCGAQSSGQTCLSVNWDREDRICQLNSETMTSQNYWYKFRFRMMNRYIDGITCVTRDPAAAAPQSVFDGQGTSTLQCGATEQAYFTGGQYRIVGGRPTTERSWPWQVVMIRGSQLFCGGALVRESVVVTAAHCLENGIQDVRVVLGRHSQGRVDQGEDSLQIVSFAIHEQYNRGTTENDIALLKLERPVVLSSTKRIACLPNEAQAPAVGTECVVTGWGTLSYSGSPTSLPTTLQEATVPIYETSVCNDPIHYNGLVKENMICAGPSGGGIDACQGDSGGPLVCKSSAGVWFLQGIISWGNGCGNPKYPGVYTKVANYYPWIQQKLASL